MIFYFSGEGNSKWVAQQLAQRLGEKLLFIPDVNEASAFQLESGESIGFVFPCYGWKVPKFVVNFVTKLQISNVAYVWTVITCGDDTGLTGTLFEHLLKNKGWHLASAWAVQMPETYICLPGFDVDSPAQEERKIQLARMRVQSIGDAILQRKEGIRDTLEGGMAWAKTYIVGPFFQRWLITDKPFRVNQRCIGCGRCAQVCSRHNITMRPSHSVKKSALNTTNSLSNKNASPLWLGDCTLCLSCYHNCPTHAIHWGRQTKKKGQYLFPRFTVL